MSSAAFSERSFAGASSETTITRSSTSLILQQTEVTLTIGISTGDGGSAENAADLMAANAGAEADSVADTAAGTRGQDGKLPDDIARLVKDVLSGLGDGGLAGPASAATAGTGGRSAMIQQLMADNAMKMSRYREADAFGQRVEGVLATSKRIIGEAKAANMLDESEKRRRERREGFKADDKMVDAAQKEVNALRAAAFGSSKELGEALGTAGLPDGGDAESVETAAAPVLAAVLPAAALDLRA